MASNMKPSQLAMCCLVQETTKDGKILDNFILGLGCLVEKPSNFGFYDFAGAASKSNCCLIASSDVLTKAHLQAVDSKMKDKKKDQSAVQIVAEFQAMDGTDKNERISLVEFYRSVDGDVCESSGILCISLTKLDRYSLFKRSPLKGRPRLQVFDFTERRVSIRELLDTDQLQCHVLCGDTMSTRIYDFFVESALEYVLSKGDKRYYTEDEFMKEEKKCLGGIILNGDCRLVGVLNFRDRYPAPVAVGSKLETGTSSDIYPKLDLPTEESEAPTSDVWCHNDETPKRCEEIDKEVNVGAAGGIFPLFEVLQPSKIPVAAHLAVGKDIEHSPQRAAKSTDTKRSVMDFEGHDTINNGQSQLDTSMTNPPNVDSGAEIDNPEMQGELQTSEQPRRVSSSPIENSYSSSCQLSSDEQSLDPLWHNGSQQAQALLRDVETFECNSECPLKGEAPLKVMLPPASDENKTYDSMVPKSLVQPSNCSQPLMQGSKETTGASGGTSDGHHSYFEQRRHSFPNSRSNVAQHPNLQRCTSDSLQRQKSRRLFSLDDPLAKSVQDSLELLEELGRCLDKEYKYGKSKCWKHLAEEFGIEAEVYEQFSACQIHSPTEVLFEYLSTCQCYLKVETLKVALCSIGRNDVVKGVLVKHEESERGLTNETLVSSLFDSNPDIIGEMAFLLDKQKHGVKGWPHLADKLHIERKVFRTFESSTDENPTEQLFDWLCIHEPRLTIGELKSHLNHLKRQDVIIAIDKSEMVKDTSVIKDLMEDLDTMENVCELLNRRRPIHKVLGWKHLGKRFGIEKKILDDFSPSEGKPDTGPTEVLVSHLAANRPDLEIRNLIWALHRIDRPDALIVLDKHLPDGYILQLLRGCDCQQCYRLNK